MRFLIYITFLLPGMLSAQVAMDDFLWSALEAPAIKAFDNQNKYLDSNPYRLAYLDELEFRTESNQLDTERQDYALRLKPANPWEVKRNNEYFQTYQETLQLDRQRELKKILKEHYKTIVEWIYLQEQKKLKEEELELSKTMIKILEAQHLSNFFDANEYTGLKVDQIEMIVALEELSFEEDAQRIQIETSHPAACNQSILWSVDGLISIDQILQSIQSEPVVSAFGEVAYRQKQIELAASEWKLEKSSIGVGFLQAQYQQYRIEQDRSPWSIGMGVTIPLFNPNKGNMTKRKLEMIEAEADLINVRDEQKAGTVLMKKKIQKLTNRYFNMQSQLDSLNIDQFSSTLQEIKDSNPTAVVKLNSSLIKSRQMAVRLQKEIYLTYIEYLGYTELLQQLPLKNYLHPDLH